MLFSLDADFRDAALMTRLYDARASLALLPDAFRQSCLRESGLLGPTPMGAYFLRWKDAEVSPWRLMSWSSEDST